MCMFERRHYKAIAEVMRETLTEYDDIDEASWLACVDGLKKLFDSDNPNFKDDRFLEACGMRRST